MKENTTAEMRKKLKDWDDLDVPMDAEFFDKLHQKIMDRIDQTTMEPPLAAAASLSRRPLSRYRELAQRFWRGDDEL